jgi:hypothetical protein
MEIIKLEFGNQPKDALEYTSRAGFQALSAQICFLAVKRERGPRLARPPLAIDAA